MKKCPYCGAKYPDDLVLCAIDGNSLSAIEPLPKPNDEQSPVLKDKPAYLIFPDYKWTALDGWKCVGIILILNFVVGWVIFALQAHFHGLRSWFVTPFGYLFGDALHYAIAILPAAYFARTESLATFWKAFGFDRKPSDYVWFGIGMALAIRFFGHYMRLHGLGKGVRNEDLVLFRHTPGAGRFLFLLPSVLLAPILEESIYRGFLYKAFRGSYPVVISTVLIVAWTAKTHWQQYSHSTLAAFDLSLLTVVQCYLREKSDSLWDCIFCHMVFNASALFLDGTLR